MNKPPCDTSDIPNPNPTQFHGKWTDWSDGHDQNHLNKKSKYKLRLKGAVPEGGKPFFVELTHMFDGTTIQLTLDEDKARSFKGVYLLKTCWNWERQFDAVP